MNKTPNTTAINNTTSPTPQKTFNYAAAVTAKRNSTQSPVPPSVVPAQQQQPPQQPVAASQAPQAVVVPSSTQQQQPNAPIAVNGTKNQSTSSPPSFAAAAKNTPQQSQILPTNGTTTAAKRSSSPQTVTGTPNKGVARTSSVTLPKQASLSTASSPIYFGTFHQTTPTPLSTSPVQPGAVSGGPPPSSPTTSVVNFGTLIAPNAIEEVASLTHQRKDSTHSNHSAASLADGQPLVPQQPTHVPSFQNHSHQGGHHLPTQPHYQPPHRQHHHSQKHGAQVPMPMGANSGPNTTGFSPVPQYSLAHQAKKQMPGHSPHLPSASAPAISAPAMPMVPQPPVPQGWNPQMGPGPSYFPSQAMYDPNAPFYQYVYGMPPRNMPTVPATSRLTPNAAAFVPPQQKVSKAIKIINPTTMAEIKTDVNPPPGSPSPAKKEPSMPVVIKMERPEDKQEKDRKEGEIIAQKAAAVTTVTPGSPAIPFKGIRIVDPASKDKEEKERKALEEKETAERKAKEEQEREEREQKEREEKEKEEKEREEKEKEEREMKERERKEREEEERIEREEQERIEREREEREKKEREERIEREEKERIEREEKERIEREREEQEREEREREEREEHDRLEREENERKEKEEKERQEKEEKERQEKERQEKERQEKERLETERLEREKERKVAEEEAERRAAEVAAAAKLLEEKKLEEEAAKEAEASPIEGEKVGKASLKLDLSTIGPGIPRAPATPLRTPRTPGTPRRTLEDLGAVQYPPNVKIPNPANPEPGKFRYDRAFLMQFMDVCTEKPDTLPALMDIVIEENPSGDSKRPPMARKSTNPRQQPKTPSAQTPGEMGSFKMVPRTSEERFTQSMRTPQMGSFQVPGGRPLGNRTGSGSNMLPPGLGGSSGGHRESSQSGRQRRQDSGRGGGKGGRSPYQVGAPTIPMEQVVPLEASENRWVPTLVAAIPVGETELIPIEVVMRKVKGLLNKLTLEKFETISDQIIEFANQSVKETDGATLKAVIQLTFEKATDEPNFAVMYARLARQMLDKVSVDIKDDNVKDPNGKVITGGNLFRKYLLNRCQEDFERGWKVDLPKVDKNEDGTVASSVDPLLSEEYYVAAKAKRRGLGLIKFIGELFKLQMLTERIMHECIKKLLSNVADPEEEETESLCKLMATVGKDLDHKKAKGWMDVYFDRMGDLLRSNKLPSRIKFMIQDVIDLRSTRWIPRRDTNAPKTIQEIHEDAQKAKEDEKEMMKRTTSSGGPGRPNMTQQLSRGSSHRGKDPRGGNGNVPPVPAQDGGWSTVGSPSTSSRKTGDLTNFGKMDRSKNSRVSLGPTAGGVFASLKPQIAKTAEVKKEDKTAPMTPTGSQIGTANMFSALNMEGGSTERRRSIEEPAKERKKLNLLPRGTSTPISENTPDLVASPLTETPPVKLTEAEADKKIGSMLAEFWSVADIQELVRCIGDLGNEYHTQAIFKVLESTIDKKEDDVKLMAKVFRTLVDDKVVTKESFKKSFGDFIEALDDISIDVPQAYKHAGILLIGAHIELVDLKELQKPLLLLGGVLPPAAKLTAEYLKALRADAGEQAMVHQYQESAFDFKSLFPEDKQSDEALNFFLDRQDLSALKA